MSGYSIDFFLIVALVAQLRRRLFQQIFVSACVCIVAERTAACSYGAMHKSTRIGVAGDVMALIANLWFRLFQQIFEIAIVWIMAKQALFDRWMNMYEGSGCGIVVNDMALIAQLRRRLFLKVLVAARVGVVAGQALPGGRGAMCKTCRQCVIGVTLIA